MKRLDEKVGVVVMGALWIITIPIHMLASLVFVPSYLYVADNKLARKVFSFVLKLLVIITVVVWGWYYLAITFGKKSKEW